MNDLVPFPDDGILYSGCSDSLAEDFRYHSIQWCQDTMFSSAPEHDHPSYQHIISLGADALPLILDAMQRAGGFWFHALRCITGEDPIPETMYGQISEMTNVWVEWGLTHDYLGHQSALHCTANCRPDSYIRRPFKFKGIWRCSRCWVHDGRLVECIQWRNSQKSDMI